MPQKPHRDEGAIVTAKEENRLADAIESLATKIGRYRSRPLGEQNTKAALIEPLLGSLGWDVHDPDEVHREYKSKSADKPVDYALQIARKPRFFVEAKGLGENLADRKWISQIVGYATVAGVVWCVLTDGDEYRFYNANAPVDAEEKLFSRIKLSEGTGNGVVRTLQLLSRETTDGDSLNRLWDSHFVDRRVGVALHKLIEDADRGLVRLVRRAAPELTATDISKSILRQKVQLEAPPAWDMARRSPPVSHVAANAKLKRNAGGKKSRRTFGVELVQLIEQGLLTPPLRLFRKYKGRVLEATLKANGTVEFQGKSYDSCSSAAEHARGTVTGRRMNTNGWSFWQYEDSTGKKRELVFARSQYRVD